MQVGVDPPWLQARINTDCATAEAQATAAKCALTTPHALQLFCVRSKTQQTTCLRLKACRSLHGGAMQVVMIFVTADTIRCDNDLTV
jgi:hypothetical protein